MNEESLYAKAKTESLVSALAVSLIIGIAFSYVPLTVLWQKLAFEIISNIIVFLLSWKLISNLLLKLKIKLWEKKHSDFVIDGHWYVLHFCNRTESGKNVTKKEKEILDAHNQYLRIGTVRIVQNMDEIRLEGGRNYSLTDICDDEITNIDLDQLNSDHNLFTTGAKWYSTNVYRLSCFSKELFGIFNVKRDSDHNEADGVHFLTVEKSDLITGRFYNSTNTNPMKPHEGEIRFYRNKETAKEAFLRALKERKQ